MERPRRARAPRALKARLGPAREHIDLAAATRNQAMVPRVLEEDTIQMQQVEVSERESSDLLLVRESLLGKAQEAQVELAVAKAVAEATIVLKVEKKASHLAAAKAAILEDPKRGLGKEITTQSKRAIIATKEDSKKEKDPKRFHLMTMIEDQLILANLSYLRCRATLFNVTSSLCFCTKSPAFQSALNNYSISIIAGYLAVKRSGGT